jgi:Xaa-Pro aminopeptidase
MSKRLNLLGESLTTSGASVFLAQSTIAMGYLHAFWESSHERFMALAVNPAGHAVLICPALSEAQAKRAGITDIRTWKDGEDPYALVKQLSDEWDLKSGVIEIDDDMPARMVLGLQAALPFALFRSGGDTLSQIMRKKDVSEINELMAAGKIADETYDELLHFVSPGCSELEVERFIHEQMSKRGGSPTFCIIGAGSGGAEPHHINGSTKLQPGDVTVMDFGCSVNGYQSDITRTVCVGQASDEAKHVYDVVYRAHMAARAAIRPGVTSQEVDAAGRAVIEAAGYGPKFFHRIGHGIGLNGHEEPYIAPGNQTVLVEGDCFSIEPGIYLEGKFGVRIENIVTVTADGHESLNMDPPASLPEIGV